MFKEGMVVKTTGRIASVPVGNELIGRIVNPTGKAIDAATWECVFKSTNSKKENVNRRFY